MNERAPFQPEDLAELDNQLLDKALAVMPMEAVYASQRWPQVIGLRHDVDNAIEPAVLFAEWEHAHGYRSTYYILHTAPYWANKHLLVRSLEIIADLGHEIGIHNNAVAAALSNGRDPRAILAEAVAELRGYGFKISSTVAHGDNRCYDPATKKLRFVNDEMFVDCPRPTLGAHDRTVAGVTLRPVPLADFGLDFDANWIGSRSYISDSGGEWSRPFSEVAEGFPFDHQLHMLLHPDWWPQAFVTEGIAA